jgi:hypothetical protein
MRLHGLRFQEDEHFIVYSNDFLGVTFENEWTSLRVEPGNDVMVHTHPTAFLPFIDDILNFTDGYWQVDLPSPVRFLIGRNSHCFELNLMKASLCILYLLFNQVNVTPPRTNLLSPK